MIDARGRKPITGVEGNAASYNLNPGAASISKAAMIQARDKSVTSIADALHTIATKSGARIGRLMFGAMGPWLESSVPWLAFELAWRACDETKRRLEAAGSASVSVAYPWDFRIPEPPPPEQPPEMDVEFPRDEPPTEYPTEDPRITED
jgi:hypothetical protein